MFELLLTCAGGLLGSAHCVGMCGGFAVALGSTARGALAVLHRQLAYSLGRICTYAFGGAVVGHAGRELARALPTAISAQAVMAVIAGLLLVWQGLAAAGLLRRRGVGPGVCLAAPLLGALLHGPGVRSAFLAGVFTGFLPCGLVYAYLAAAAASGHAWSGAWRMAAFGVGTAPALILMGLGAGVISLRARQRLLRLAAVCVVLTGLVSLARGVGYLPGNGGVTGQGCPACSVPMASGSERRGHAAWADILAREGKRTLAGE